MDTDTRLNPFFAPASDSESYQEEPPRTISKIRITSVLFLRDQCEPGVFRISAQPPLAPQRFSLAAAAHRAQVAASSTRLGQAVPRAPLPAWVPGAGGRHGCEASNLNPASARAARPEPTGGGWGDWEGLTGESAGQTPLDRTSQTSCKTITGQGPRLWHRRAICVRNPVHSSNHKVGRGSLLAGVWATGSCCSWPGSIIPRSLTQGLIKTEGQDVVQGFP